MRRGIDLRFSESRRHAPARLAEPAPPHLGAAAVADRVTSEFLMLASHEMRGPIAVLRGYLDMLMSGTLGDVNPRIAHTMPILMAKVDHMALLVEQILDAARVEDHRLALSLEQVDLRDVAEECTASAAAFIGAGQRLRLQLPDQAVRSWATGCGWRPSWATFSTMPSSTRRTAARSASSCRRIEVGRRSE